MTIHYSETMILFAHVLECFVLPEIIRLKVHVTVCLGGLSVFCSKNFVFLILKQFHLICQLCQFHYWVIAYRVILETIYKINVWKIWLVLKLYISHFKYQILKYPTISLKSIWLFFEREKPLQVHAISFCNSYVVIQRKESQLLAAFRQSPEACFRALPEIPGKLRLNSKLIRHTNKLLQIKHRNGKNGFKYLRLLRLLSSLPSRWVPSR